LAASQEEIKTNERSTQRNSVNILW